MTSSLVIGKHTHQHNSVGVSAHLLSPEDIPYVWEDIEPLLAKVSKHTEGEMLPEDFMTPLEEGLMQLWVAIEEKNIVAVMVTQIVPYPQKKTLRVIAIAGSDFKGLHARFNDIIEGFAVRVGCSSMELWGRKGWKKLLPDWKDSYIVYTKDIKTRMQ